MMHDNVCLKCNTINKFERVQLGNTVMLVCLKCGHQRELHTLTHNGNPKEYVSDATGNIKLP
jgi:hypothetical protein